MTKPPKNIGASVRGRLLRLATERGEDFQLLLTRYASKRHGLGRWWHDNGQLAREKDVLSGTVLRRRDWDDDGNLADEYKLDKNDELYKDVLKQKERDAGG